MSIQEPSTIGELVQYIKDYKDYIYVREQVDGKWGSYALSELPVDKAIDHALRFIQEERTSVRILESKEDKND